MIRWHHRLSTLILAFHSLASCRRGADAFTSGSFAGAAKNDIPRGRPCQKTARHASRRHSPTGDAGGRSESSQPVRKVTRNGNNLSRRRWISTAASSASATLLALPLPAPAAPPLTASSADDLTARIERSLRPRPARVLRPRMNLDFAVLLMRSSYNAVDAIDVVAMDQFQRDFFLIRQAEYRTYADALGAGAMTQGDLADPNYFDFISFAQYATINREIANPPSVFEEQQPVEAGEGEPQRFDRVIVRRDASLTNGDLARRHTEIVGGAILDKLDEKFSKTASAIPKMEPGSRPGADAVLAAVRQMVSLFVLSGFALDGNAKILKSNGENSVSAGGTQFSITFTSPVTLWSGQSLKAKGNAVLTNDFALKTAREMLSRAGYTVTNASVKYTNNQEITTFTII